MKISTFKSQTTVEGNFVKFSYYPLLSQYHPFLVLLCDGNDCRIYLISTDKRWRELKRFEKITDFCCYSYESTSYIALKFASFGPSSYYFYYFNHVARPELTEDFPQLVESFESKLVFYNGRIIMFRTFDENLTTLDMENRESEQQKIKNDSVIVNSEDPCYRAFLYKNNLKVYHKKEKINEFNRVLSASFVGPNHILVVTFNEKILYNLNDFEQKFIEDHYFDTSYNPVNSTIYYRVRDLIRDVDDKREVIAQKGPVNYFGVSGNLFMEVSGEFINSPSIFTYLQIHIGNL